LGRKIDQIKKELLANEEFRQEYDALEEEFIIAMKRIEAQTKENLTEDQVV